MKNRTTQIERRIYWAHICYLVSEVADKTINVVVTGMAFLMYVTIATLFVWGLVLAIQGK